MWSEERVGLAAAMPGADTGAEALSLARFARLCGQRFQLRLGRLPPVLAQLVHARSLGPPRVPQGPEPFSLVFRGPVQPQLPQRIYELSHPQIPAPLPVFLVPVAARADAVQYEAVFGTSALDQPDAALVPPACAHAAATPCIGQLSIVTSRLPPSGWALCDGQLMPIARHPLLFALLGTRHGGDGRSTFALPDLRQRLPAPQAMPGAPAPLQFVIALTGPMPATR